MPTSIFTTGADTAAVRDVLDRAEAALVTHTGRDNMCAGCLDLWARLAPVPCEQRRWALAVIERYGAAPSPTTSTSAP